jgi:hypothetical protein
MNAHNYRSPKVLSWLAMTGITLVGLCWFAAGLIGIAQIVDPNRTFGIDESDRLSLWSMLQGVLMLLQFGVFVVAGIMFLAWLYRVYTNLPALGSDNTEFTPGWAVGWWFIPFANLIKPFQAVRNAWAESDPDVNLEHGFLTSVQSGAPAFMGIWWAFWILSNIAVNITTRVWEPDDVRSVALSGYFFLLTGILWAIAAAFSVKVILNITNRQEQRFRNVGMMRPQMPPPPPPTFG